MNDTTCDVALFNVDTITSNCVVNWCKLVRFWVLMTMFILCFGFKSFYLRMNQFNRLFLLINLYHVLFNTVLDNFCFVVPG